MVTRGAAGLFGEAAAVSSAPDERLITMLGIACLILCWLLLRGGLQFVRRVNDFVGPALLILATVTVLMLVMRYGALQLWNSSVSSAAALTGDRRKTLAFALEFGVTYSLTWWPYLGGLYRLLKYRRHTVGPLMLGFLSGGAYCSAVAAFAAVSVGSADPITWMIILFGRRIGALIVTLLLLMNIPTICMLVYFAGMSLQQYRRLARIPWSSLSAITLAPLALAVFNSRWVLTHVGTIATYGGLMFLGVAAVGLVDFYILRRQSIALEQIFAVGERGQYWFWSGVNWIAMFVIFGGLVAYLSMYDPISLRTSTQFRYFGAALPVMLASAVSYYLLSRLITIPARRGGYLEAATEVSAPVHVRL
jgi:NCS1 family nucleobase:cation symporter-1